MDRRIPCSTFGWSFRSPARGRRGAVVVPSPPAAGLAVWPLGPATGEGA